MSGSTKTSSNEDGSSHHSGHTRSSGAALALAALGVVYGDIGTSPLYALRECFSGSHGIAVTNESVMGVLSLVFWVLIIVISVKYMGFVLRADNRGEGGILALTALAIREKFANAPAILAGIGIFGAALLYGDGVITPAISVLSAIEGLRLVTPVFDPWVIPITCAVLVGLFTFQKYGTARIGAVFGPVMIVWFSTLGILGIKGIMENPAVLYALNPWVAIDFFSHHQMEGFYVMGALFLVVTGGEALYADMGHFGRSPIRKAWFGFALPGLLLNYFGQGALLLSNPAAAENPFFLLAPAWGLVPLVILATISTTIASQAVISGVFSLTRQAIQLGLSPRMQIVHTSSREIGQIYLPQMNWALLVGTLWLVITFKSSSGLAAAYGISVSTAMVITTVLMFIVARKVWNWSFWLAAPIMLFFFVVDLLFMSANVVKIEQGGYVPLIIAGVLYFLMVTWRRGRQILAERLRNSVIRMTEFIKQLRVVPLARVSGVAVFMVGDAKTTPPALVHNVKHNKVLHEKSVLLTVQTSEFPVVPAEERVKFEIVDEAFNIYRVVAKYGFSDSPDMVEIIECLNAAGLKIDLATATFFLGRETLLASENPGMAIWREHVFSFMSRNAQRATAFFNIPADQVVEVGMQVKL